MSTLSRWSWGNCASMWLGICLAAVAPSAIAADLSLSGRESAVQPRSLRVSLYPYIPDAASAYLAIKQAFEARHPDVRLKISLNPNYYDHEPDKGGILFEDADVYEFDSVFLMDFIKRRKIKPVGSSWWPGAESLLPFARTAASPNGVMWGMPHWVCGNFLVYKDGDTALESVKTLGDLERVIGPSPPATRSLLIDLKGKSTLGEMYLDALMDRYGSREVALSHTDPANIDQAAVSVMSRSLALAAPGFARDDDYHDTTGFYARQFARGYGRALVGYSEQLYHVLTESASSCRKNEGCLKHSEIRIAEWPIADEGSRPISWVDMFGISAKAHGKKQRDAENFIRFMMEPSTYKLFLIPGWGQAPRYLLPARDDLYRDPEILKGAPLYASFRERIDRATPITDVGLNERLRLIGKNLDKLLPAGR